jgi:ABC-type antimicrobial peptide transport system permease subunit
MANLVGERTREIRVRLAMGARREDVLLMILRRAAWLTGTGICAGFLLAFGLAHGVGNLLYEVHPDDPMVFGAINAKNAPNATVANQRFQPSCKLKRASPAPAIGGLSTAPLKPRTMFWRACAETPQEGETPTYGKDRKNW